MQWVFRNSEKAGFGTVGFARIDDLGEAKADVAKTVATGRGIVSKLKAPDGINLTGDRNGIAPFGDAARERIVDAQDFLADCPISVGRR